MKLIGINQFLQWVEVEVKGKKIISVNPCKEMKEKRYIIPGFIDVHTHGGYGFDWSTTNKKKCLEYLINLPKKEGVTSVLGTTLTSSKENLQNTIKFAKSIVKSKGANFLGLHLEGPFLNVFKKGGHPPEHLLKLTKKSFELFHMNDENSIIKYITYAPELTSPEVTKYIHSKGVICSAGHTMAKYDDKLIKHIKNGLSNITHFNNAMIKYDTKDDSLAKYAITSNDLYIEFINDGIHNPYSLAKKIYISKPSDKIILITDSIYPKGLDDGIYSGQNWNFHKKNGAIYTPTNILTGSSYTMIKAFKDWMQIVGATLDEAVLATSTNAANCLNLKKGKILENYDADILILDQHFEIIDIYINGIKN